MNCVHWHSGINVVLSNKSVLCLKNYEGWNVFLNLILSDYLKNVILLDTQRMKDQLEIIKNTSQSLSNLTKELQEGLDEAKDNLTDILKNCSNVPSVKPTCDNINSDDLATGANFTALPDVSSELENVEKVVNQDFEKTAEEVSYFLFTLNHWYLWCCYLHQKF